MGALIPYQAEEEDQQDEDENENENEDDEEEGLDEVEVEVVCFDGECTATELTGTNVDFEMKVQLNAVSEE